jgi:hypothetical protein
MQWAFQNKTSWRARVLAFRSNNDLVHTGNMGTAATYDGGWTGQTKLYDVVETQRRVVDDARAFTERVEWYRKQKDGRVEMDYVQAKIDLRRARWRLFAMCVRAAIVYAVIFLCCISPPLVAYWPFFVGAAFVVFAILALIGMRRDNRYHTSHWSRVRFAPPRGDAVAAPDVARTEAPPLP